MADLDCKKPKRCEPEPAQAPVPCSEPFDLCVGDRTLKWDGFCPTVERTRNTPDGTYTSVTVVDGCIVDYGYADEPTYTPPYCSPNPTPCQIGGDGSTGGFTISSSANNSLVNTTNGLFARTYIRGAGGVEVTGTGTSDNPYIVAANASGGGSVVVGRNGVDSETSSNGVNYVGLETINGVKGVYNGVGEITIDGFGRVTAIEPIDDDIVVAGAGLTSANDGGKITISHPAQQVDTSIAAGAYVLTISDTGHITGTERAVTLDSGVYNLGVYNVGINEYGGIYSIEQRSDVLPSAGSFTTADGKVFNYDISGRLVSTNSTVQSTGTNGRGLPLPLRDMLRITQNLDPSTDTSSLNVEYYGEELKVRKSAATTTLDKITVTLPSYVLTAEQVDVSGATSWELVADERVLNINAITSVPFTITVSFRG